MTGIIEKIAVINRGAVLLSAELYIEI